MTWQSLHDLLREQTDDDNDALDRYRPRPAMSTYRMRRAVGQMSDAFLEGIPEVTGATEKAVYRSGEWLHQQRSAESKRASETKARKRST
jgi:hypothetical protein